MEQNREARELENRRKAYSETYREILCDTDLEAELTCADLVSDGFVKGTLKGHEHEYVRYYDDTEHVARIAVYVVNDHGTAAYIAG